MFLQVQQLVLLLALQYYHYCSVTTTPSTRGTSTQHWFGQKEESAVQFEWPLQEASEGP